MTTAEGSRRISYKLRWYHWALILLMVIGAVASPYMVRDLFDVAYAFMLYGFIVWAATILFRWIRHHLGGLLGRGQPDSG